MGVKKTEGMEALSIAVLNVYRTEDWEFCEYRI